MHGYNYHGCHASVGGGALRGTRRCCRSVNLSELTPGHLHSPQQVTYAWHSGQMTVAQVTEVCCVCGVGCVRC